MHSDLASTRKTNNANKIRDFELQLRQEEDILAELREQIFSMALPYEQDAALKITRFIRRNLAKGTMTWLLGHPSDPLRRVARTGASAWRAFELCDHVARAGHLIQGRQGGGRDLFG